MTIANAHVHTYYLWIVVAHHRYGRLAGQQALDYVRRRQATPRVQVQEGRGVGPAHVIREAVLGPHSRQAPDGLHDQVGAASGITQVGGVVPAGPELQRYQ